MPYMGVERIFSKGGPTGDFLGVAKIGKICFFPLETKKTTFFAKISKIQWGCHHSDTHDVMSHS